MSSHLEIRKATIADAQFLALLGRITYFESHKIYFEDQNDIKTYCNEEYSVAKIKQNLADENTIYWIALADDLPVGFSLLQLNKSTPLLSAPKVCKLQKIYVLSNFTSMNIGRQLHNTMIEEAKTRKFEKLWLTAYHKNTRAINFYTKNGFQKIGEDIFEVQGVHYKQTVLAIDL